MWPAALNDLTNVGGNVALGGKLNVALSPGGRFDVGIYRIINYGGTLSNPAGLTLGTLPAGANAADYFIQTSVDKQVNLAYTNGLTLNYWDGDAGPKNNNQVNGGAGTWVAPGGVNDNWTDAAGSVNAPWSQGAFAVFTGQSGTVRVDSTTNGPINVQGMQFATDGYVLQGNAAGDKLTLTGTPTGGGGPNEAVIRVGAGSADGAGYTATISAVLDGAAKLVKTDLGTLVLSGINTYTGGTAVNGGTLQVSQDSNMGALAGALSLNGGTLATTATFDTARATTLGAGGGSFNVAAGTNFGITSAVSGSGALSKLGTGTLILGANNTYAGGTTIAAGTLQLGSGAGGLDGGQHPRQRQQQRHAGVQPQQHVYLRRHHQRRGQRRTDGLRHHRADRQQQLHRRHADFRRGLAARGGRGDGQHQRQRHQQWRAGVQPRRYLHLWRPHQRHWQRHAAGQRHDGADGQQQLHGRHHDLGGHTATGRGRHDGQHRRRRRQQRRAGVQPRRRVYLRRPDQRRRRGHAGRRRHHGADRRQYLRRRHHDLGRHAAIGQWRRDRQRGRPDLERRHAGRGPQQQRRARRPHTRQRQAGAAGRGRHLPDRRQHLQRRHCHFRRHLRLAPAAPPAR